MNHQHLLSIYSWKKFELKHEDDRYNYRIFLRSRMSGEKFEVTGTIGMKSQWFGFGPSHVTQVEGKMHNEKGDLLSAYQWSEASGLEKNNHDLEIHSDFKSLSFQSKKYSYERYPIDIFKAARGEIAAGGKLYSDTGRRVFDLISIYDTDSDMIASVDDFDPSETREIFLAMILFDLWHTTYSIRNESGEP